MLVLCSDGLTSQGIMAEFQKRIAKGCNKAALVVTADNVYKERNYHVPRCRDELLRIGCLVDTVDIDMMDPRRLLTYDLVEFIGGNPFYLMDSIHRNHAEGVLWTLSKEKILIGWSAAAFVFGLSLELVNEYTPEMNTVSLTDLSGLGLAQIEVLPHYSKFMRRFENFEERCAQYETRKGIQVIRLNDGDGLFLTGDHSILFRA